MTAPDYADLPSLLDEREALIRERDEARAADADRLREALDEHRAHYVDPTEHARLVNKVNGR